MASALAKSLEDGARRTELQQERNALMLFKSKGDGETAVDRNERMEFTRMIPRVKLNDLRARLAVSEEVVREASIPPIAPPR